MRRPVSLLISSLLGFLVFPRAAGAGNLGAATAGGGDSVVEASFSVEYDVRSVEARVADVDTGEPTGQDPSLAWLRAGGPYLGVRITPVRYLSFGGRIGLSRPLLREGSYEGLLLVSFGADARITPVHVRGGLFRAGLVGQFELTRDRDDGGYDRFRHQRIAGGLGATVGDDREGFNLHFAVLYNFVDGELRSADGGTRYRIRTQIPVGGAFGAELITPVLNPASRRAAARLRASLEVRVVDAWGVGGQVGVAF